MKMQNTVALDKVLPLAWRRARKLFARMDIEGAELFSGLAAIGVAGVLAFPGDYLQSNVALKHLANFAPESFYTIVSAVLGAAQLLACVLGGKPSAFINSPFQRSLWLIVRQKFLQSGFGVWLGLTVFLAMGGAYLIAVFLILSAGACACGSYKVTRLLVRHTEAENMLSYRDGVTQAEESQLSTAAP